MARGKKPAITSRECRLWLEKLEAGDGITRISKAVGRDIRVVKRHIELAREERQVAHVRRDFLLGRLQLHQDDLLAEVRRLRQEIRGPRPSSLEPVDPMPKKVHQALREHTQRLPLRKLLDLYVEALADYETERDAVKHKLADKEAELTATLTGSILLFPWTPRLAEVLENAAATAFPDRPYLENRQDDGTYRPSWSEFSLTQSPIPGAALGPVLKKHRELVSESQRYLPGLQAPRQRLQVLSEQIGEELDIFEMKRLVPGRCRYCPF